MVTFWFCFSGLCLLTTVCSLINIKLNRFLEGVIPWINETLQPALRRNLHFDQARTITNNILPELEEWYEATKWYSVVVMILQILLFTIAGLVSFSNGIPYILLVIMAMLLGSMVFFFPRTIMRRYKAKEIFAHLFYAYAALLTEILLKEKVDNGSSASNNGTNTHS